ncbi:2-oxoglutarate dehydrogenase E2 component (dihydrolipoamide succinyltransferase) [Arcanobacterium pluranimalium]|uniref:2-oxoglutarate dehydrogenase, E2 component, dihydrolipoamide succinyltransferase n=1 Tax=Arcanobacterium pluranimalium TaxID=108028 RepID=UPI001959DAD7|nr:2-oxoglutarate dehydrogenase, E2 component, dihydrolipoamide succinyltransferase [Arcanobacterium pluranimalium]MBM7825529.1 2-oxoglutarate dehydrogenase E2 component (dihydrolipoamide succinyltransferase) [Arcanobacterium pluranimalium]
MSEPIKMPALGESVTEGTVTTWLKEVGDTVEADEPILEVSTDKVDTEVPAPAAGVLEKIIVNEDETVDVGTVLGYIGDGSGTADSNDSGANEEAKPSEESAQDSDKGNDEPAAKPESNSGNSADAVEVKMPALGESVTEGTVTTWLKEVGDTVEEDEPILEVSTDKVDTEVPAPAAGVITKIIVNEDETVEVGTVLAIIGGESEDSAPAEEAPKAAEAPAESSSEENSEPKAEPAAQASPASAPAVSAAQEAPADTVSSESAYVTPIVRKLAKELDVDLNSVKGTGVGGRVRRQDIEAAAETAKAAANAAAPVASAPAAASAPATAATGSVKAQVAQKAAQASSKRGTRQKMSGLRKTIAKRMIESLETSAQLTTVMEVDVTRIVALRAKAKDAFTAREGVKLTYLPFFIKAATEALKAHPIINSSVEGSEIVYHNVEHVGIAVDTEKGLFVPVIKNAGDLNIAGISKAVGDLAARTRDGKIGADEMAGSTFTITNTGSIGAIFDTPIINQPNVAIMGTGAIFKAPGVVKDQDGNEVIAIRSKCYLSISYDHRIVDGADASRFLRDVKDRLEEGDFGAEIGL